MSLDDVANRGVSVEYRLERMNRAERDETTAYTSLEQWAEDAEDAIFRGVDKHSKSSIRAALVHVGYHQKKELIFNMQEINDLQKLFKDFIKSNPPPRENPNKLSKHIQDIAEVNVEKADPETNYSDGDVGVPILSTTEAKINDESGVSALSERDLLRVFHGEGIKHSEHAHEGDKEMANKLVNNAADAVEEAREELEKQIASYIGRNICYIEQLVIEEIDVDAVEQLNEIYQAMQTGWRDGVGWHIEKITESSENRGPVPKPHNGNGIERYSN